MMKIKHVLVAFAMTGMLAAANAQTTTQGFTGASGFSSNWNQQTMGSVTFASGTNAISALTTSMDIVDQGWGGEDPNANQVYISLNQGASQLWWAHVAGATHSSTFQSFDITTQPSLLSSLNAAMGGIDWSSNPTVTLSMQTGGLGYPGWSLSATNASLSVTSIAAVPEPATYAMLLAGLGMLGFTARRKATAA